VHADGFKFREMASDAAQQPVEVERTVTPSAEDISLALQQLLLQEPTMGLKKLHAGVKGLHADWIVSEARVKKIKDSLVGTPQPAAAAEPVHLPAFDEHGRVAGTSSSGLNFNFRSVSGFLPELDPAVMNQLHSDCRRAFLMKSYWLSATSAPRCMLEAIARSVFDFHTRGVSFDPAASGAEWWVHFRGPSEDKKLGKPLSLPSHSQQRRGAVPLIRCRMPVISCCRGEHRFPLGQGRNAGRCARYQSVSSD
jgi:hypothetical protein